MRRLTALALVLGAVAPASAVGSIARLSVTGPTSGLKLNTPYSYTVNITSPKSFSTVYFAVSLTGCTQVVHRVRLTAKRTLTRKVNVTYEQNAAPLTLEFSASVLGRHPKALADRKLSVALEAGQPDTSGSIAKCNALFGS